MPQSCAASNPAIALRLQSTRPAGRVAELGSLVRLPRAMKRRAILLFIVCCQAIHVDAQELSLLGQLPELRRDWTLRNQATKKEGAYEYSWATFTNSKTGDLISFAADKYTNANRAVGSDPVRQAATDMFPGGLPRFMHDRPTGWLIADVIRFSVVTLETGVDATRKNVKAEALEYSYVYESEAHSAPNRLAHGYVLAFGDTVVFVQHTSTHVITSDDARSTVLSVLRNHPSSRPLQ